MGYSTRTEKTKSGKYAARTMTGAYGAGYTVHLTEEFDSAAEAYAAAEAWKKAQAAANAAKKADKNKAQMTCQCCGRKHLANTGKMAHHGYQRPGGGWQTASCSGARELPYEVSRDALGRLIHNLKIWEKQAIETLEAVKAEEIPVMVTVTDMEAEYDKFKGKRPKKNINVTRGTFAALQSTLRKAGIYSDFEDIKEREVHIRTDEVEGVRREIKFQTERFESWKQTHKWDKASKTWKKV